MITPTIGRVVWFRPGEEDQAIMAVKSGYQPMKADVILVKGDRFVDLDVVDHGGRHHYREGVRLLQDGDKRPLGSYCEWMPYQKGQAAKAEALEKQLERK